jgi:hypothetical protein
LLTFAQSGARSSKFGARHARFGQPREEQSPDCAECECRANMQVSLSESPAEQITHCRGEKLGLWYHVADRRHSEQQV